MSRHLGKMGIRGVIKLGNIVIPGDHEYPSFEIYFKKSQGDIAIDRMLDHLVKDDLAGLKMLLPLVSVMPNFVLKLLMLTVDNYKVFPGFMQMPFRLLYIGLKGLVLTLYYSDLDGSLLERGEVLQKMGWDPKMENDREMSMHQDSISTVFLQAKAAANEIKKIDLTERLKYISAIKKVVIEKREYIIDRIQADTKKTRLDAMASEIFPLLDHLEFLEKKAKTFLADQTVPTPLAMMGKKSQVIYDQLGIILVISPWNYPFYQALTPITTSFVCGNATVYKPSEFTPLTGLVEEILSLSGLQKYWAQVVYGDGEVGRKLIEAGPDKIFFTGSVKTGKAIMKAASEKLIPVELELGGKDPMIVFEDANLERAVAGALWGAFTNTGQSCTSIENLFVHEKIYPQFMKLLKEKMSCLTLGVDHDGSKDIGYMTTKAQAQIVKDQLGELMGKNVQVSGKKWDAESLEIPPMVIEGEMQALKVFREETFGPLLPVVKFSDESEMIELVNRSEYGLSASVWSHDKKRCLRVARALKTGNVSINNVMLTEGNHHLPFGGVKNSGIGRYKGRWGLESFSNIKSILIDGDSSKIEANWYPYNKEKYFLFSNMMINLFGKGPISFIKFAFYGMKLEAAAARAWKQLGIKK